MQYTNVLKALLSMVIAVGFTVMPFGPGLAVAPSAEGATANINKLVFDQEPAGSIETGEQGHFVVQTQNSSNTSENADSTITVTLSDNGGGGTWYEGTIGGDCNAVLGGNEITISSGTAQKAFCYSNGSAGTYDIQASTVDGNNIANAETQLTVEAASCDPQNDTGDSSDPVENTDNGEYFDTIQDAIDDCDTVDGHTIVADNGTYLENVTVDKEVALHGANQGVSGDDGSRSSETIVEGYVRISASNVVVDGIKLLNGGGVLGQQAGFYLDAGSNDVTITNNVIEKNDGSAPGSGDTTRGVLTDTGGVDNLTITENLSTRWHSGLYLDNISNSTISGNTLDANFVGVSFDSVDTVSFEENDVANNGFEGIGVGVDATSLSINQNNITSNNGNGLDNYTDDSIDAEENWWGDASGPSGDGSGSGDSVNGEGAATGPVDFAPWLCGPFETDPGVSNNGSCEPKTETHVDITGDTISNFGQGRGWMFNRDQSTKTPYEFNDEEASLDDGSIEIFPIGSNPSDKFIGEYVWDELVSNVDSISYDFQIGGDDSSSDADQFYLNVYTHVDQQSQGQQRFYDCKYDLVPQSGTPGSFETVTFDPEQDYQVTKHQSSNLNECPDSPSDLPETARLTFFSINVGDTSANDQGLDGHYDKVVIEDNDEITTFDFEPEPTREEGATNDDVECEGWSCLNEDASSDAPQIHKDFETTSRFGGTGWDNSIKNPDAGDIVNDNNAWTDEQTRQFTLSYNPSNGEVVYTVGDAAPLTYSYDANKAFDAIAVVAKASESDGSTELQNLTLNGTNYGDVYAATQKWGIQVELTDAEQQNGFTLTGSATLNWPDNRANDEGSDETPGFQIFALGTHDLDIPDEPSECVVPETLQDDQQEDVTVGYADYERLWEVFEAEEQQGDADFAAVDTQAEVNNNQTQIQFFNQLKDSTQVKVTYIRHSDHQHAGNSNVVGYYNAGDASSFTPLFEHNDHTGYNATPGADGASKTFTVTDDFGFAIQSETANGQNQYGVYSENNLNQGGQDRVVMYQLDTDKYAIGFEDLYGQENAGSDLDFEDMTILVEIVGCEDDQKPQPGETTVKICKALLDKNDDSTEGSTLGDSFSITLNKKDSNYSTTTTFTTPLDYNEDFFDQSNDGNDVQCVELNVPSGSYTYTEEDVDPESNYLDPEYHDGYLVEPSSWDNFSEYGETNQSDGVMNGLGDGETRTLTILNQEDDDGEVGGGTPVDITVYKHIETGDTAPEDFSFEVLDESGSTTPLLVNGATQSQTSFSGSSNGTGLVLTATTTGTSTFTISEMNGDGYSQSFSGDCNDQGEIDINPENRVEYTCSIVNEIDRAPVCEPEVNLLGNPSFESPNVTHPLGWNVFDGDGSASVVWEAQWISPSGGAPTPAHLELHAGVNNWAPSEGDQYTELDSDYEGPGGGNNESASVKIYQDVDVEAGETYTLSYDFSPRPGQPTSENVVEVLVDGSIVQTQSADGTGLSDTDWETYTYTFVATTSQVTIGFQDDGVSNTRGTFLDNTSLTCEPRDNNEEDDDGSISGTKYEIFFPTLLGEDGPSFDDLDLPGNSAPGWEIFLYEDGELVDSTMTDEGGNYSFDDVPFGDYLVCEEDRDGWMQMYPHSGPGQAGSFDMDFGFGTGQCPDGTAPVGHNVMIDNDNPDSNGNDFENKRHGDGGGETPICEPGKQWADEVILEETTQGTQKDGDDIPSSRSDVEEVLGEEDGEFYSLGEGGVLTVKFDEYILPTEDLEISVHEVTNGRDSYPEETATVEVSQNGDSWETVGTASSQSANGLELFDISSTGLDYVQYVRLTDTTDFGSHNANADGFDVDAINGEYGVCEEPEGNGDGGNGNGDGDGNESNPTGGGPGITSTGGGDGGGDEGGDDDGNGEVQGTTTERYGKGGDLPEMLDELRDRLNDLLDTIGRGGGGGTPTPEVQGATYPGLPNTGHGGEKKNQGAAIISSLTELTSSLVVFKDEESSLLSN